MEDLLRIEGSLSIGTERRCGERKSVCTEIGGFELREVGIEPAKLLQQALRVEGDLLDAGFDSFTGSDPVAETVKSAKQKTNDVGFPYPRSGRRDEESLHTLYPFSSSS